MTEPAAEAENSGGDAVPGDPAAEVPAIVPVPIETLPPLPVEPMEVVPPLLQLRAEPVRDRWLLQLVILLALAVGVGLVSWRSTALERSSETFAHLRFAGEQLRQGTVPLWDPASGIGQPFLSNGIIGVFYPTTGLFMLKPQQFGWAWRIAAMLHLFWAGCGAWLLARCLGARGPSALWRGAVFMLGGYAVSVLNSGGESGVAWIPWGLLLVEWIIRRPTLRRSLLLALMTMLVVLADNPSAACAFLLAGVLWWISRWNRPAKTVVSLLAIVGGYAVGIALAGLQFLPALEHAWESTHLPTPHGGGQWLAGMLSPYSAYITGRTALTAAAWVGTLPLVLAVLALAKSARAAALWRWVAIGIIAACVAGAWPNLSDGARRVLGIVRPDPAPFWALTGLAIAMLSGIGFDLLCAAPDLPRRWLRPVAVVLTLAALVAIAIGWLMHRHAGMRLTPALMLLIPVGVLWIAMLQQRAPAHPWQHPSRALLALAIVELLIFAIPVAGRSAVGDASIDASALAFLNEHASTDTPFRVWAAPGVLPPMSRNASRVGTDADPSARAHLWRQALPATEPADVPAAQVARMLEVRYAISNNAAAPALNGWPRVYPSTQPGSPASTSGIYENPDSPMPFWLANAAEWQSTPAQADANLPSDARQKVVLDEGLGDLAMQWLAWLRKHGGIPGDSHAALNASRVTSASANQITLNSPSWFLRHLKRETFNTGQGWLVIASAYAPGWTARYEYHGGATPKIVLPADGLLQAIPLPDVVPTETTLVVEYKPLAFKRGIYLSVGAALLWLILLALTARARSSDFQPIGSPDA